MTLAELQAFDPQAPANRCWCPLCGQEKPKDAAHRSLSFDRSSGKWKCFRCGVGGVLQEYWRENKGRDRRGLEKGREGLRLRISTGLQPSPARPPTRPLPADGVPVPAESADGVAKPPTGDSTENSSANAWREKWDATLSLANTPGEEYLRQRGISLEVAQWANVAFSSDWNAKAPTSSSEQVSRNVQRALLAVVFPIRNREGEIVAAQARAIRGSAKLTAGPKKNGVFFAPVRMKSGRVFTPLDRSTPVVAITEAPLDALSLACVGFPAIALCGTSGPAWLHIACGLRRVALALDADEAGDRASGEIERLLIPFGAQCTRLKPVGAKDWNEMLVREGRVVLEEFLIPHLM